MYDWNGNGKHDSFDDAMFMALAEDDLKRYPPGKRTYRSNLSSSFFEEMGCMLYFILLIFAPLCTAFMFFIEGEGGIALGAIVLGILLNIGVFCLLGNSTSTNKTNKNVEMQTTMKCAESSTPTTSTNSTPALKEFRYDPKTEVKAASKACTKSETKPTSVSEKNLYSSSYTPSYRPVYTPVNTFSSVLDNEPEETVRERLDYDLIGSGYDSYDLEWMDEDERNQILEDNLLDPYDYDFDDLD